MIFGRTDLRTGVSEAKFDAESDFEVRLPVARQKPNQHREKLNFRSKKFWHFFSKWHFFQRWVKILIFSISNHLD